MAETLTETLSKLRTCIPSEPFMPTALDMGIVEQLREMAELIENGGLRITHFLLTTDAEQKQRLELNIE